MKESAKYLTKSYLVFGADVAEDVEESRLEGGKAGIRVER